MAYSNLGPASYVELGMAEAADSLMDVPLFKNLGAKYGKTPA